MSESNFYFFLLPFEIRILLIPCVSLGIQSGWMGHVSLAKSKELLKLLNGKGHYCSNSSCGIMQFPHVVLCFCGCLAMVFFEQHRESL